MPDSVLPPFEEANQTPDGENAYVYRFRPQDAHPWVVAHDWSDVHEALCDTEDYAFLIERTAIPRDEYGDLRNQEVHFDGW